MTYIKRPFPSAEKFTFTKNTKLQISDFQDSSNSAFTKTLRAFMSHVPQWFHAHSHIIELTLYRQSYDFRRAFNRR